MSTETEERSLLSVFYRLQSTTEDGASNGEIQEGLQLAKSLTRALEAVQSFSKNETIDEIPTSDLKFLLVPYYHAMLLTRVQDDPEEKIRILTESMERLKSFLVQLWEYGLCGDLAKRLFRDEEAVLKNDVSKNVELLRTRKIERSKRERFLQMEIQRLRNLAKRQTQFEEDSKEYSWIDGLDEEHERRVWILDLEMMFFKALTQKELLVQEIEILQFASTQTRAPNVVNPTPPTQFQSIVKNLQRRQNIKDQIFRPSHLLPTMTVEQFGALEQQRALQAGPKPQEEVKEEDEEDVYKTRAWDDWKDGHPRGWGNSRLKPCGR